MQYRITQYPLEQGALEIQYIEEFFWEFPRKKTAAEIVARLKGRAHLILMADAPLSDDPTTVVPVSFKVAHEVTPDDRDPKLADLIGRLHDCVTGDGLTAPAVDLEGRRAFERRRVARAKTGEGYRRR